MGLAECKPGELERHHHIGHVILLVSNLARPNLKELLLIKHEDQWIFPRITPQPDEDLRSAAKRILTNLCGDKTNISAPTEIQGTYSYGNQIAIYYLSGLSPEKIAGLDDSKIKWANAAAIEDSIIVKDFLAGNRGVHRFTPDLSIPDFSFSMP